MGASQRTKGAVYEREVANYLSDELGREVKRNIGQARDGGDDITIGKFRLECKRRARIGNIYEWLDQAQAASEVGECPVVVARGDGRRSVAIVDLAIFTQLMREAL